MFFGSMLPEILIFHESDFPRPNDEVKKYGQLAGKEVPGFGFIPNIGTSSPESFSSLPGIVANQREIALNAISLRFATIPGKAENEAMSIP